MKRFRMRQGPFNGIGFLFSLAGFILVLLCLVGCLAPSGRGLYFAKVSDASGDKAFSAYYGWQGYCLEEQGQTTCFTDRELLVVPLDVAISDQLNATHPNLFTDAIPQDQDLNPEAAPNPAHDPRIYPAAVICLVCSSVLLLLCVLRVALPRQYPDQHYYRGFLAAGCTVLSLLLIILSSVMYQDAVDQLNKEYPHLIAVDGPCMTMIGVAFACFFLAAYSLLRGSMSMDSNNTSTEGYNPI